MSSDSQSVKAKAIILDIEGTTTSISFVKDVLFPYARQHARTYLEKNWNTKDTQDIVKEFRKQAEIDTQSGISSVPILESSGTNQSDVIDSLLKNMFCQMDSDRKTTCLKALQGHIWSAGYDTDQLKSHVYEDVPRALERWKQNGKVIFIYSSGSVQAQVLLFLNTEFGDVTSFLSGYYDTHIGPKTEADSYRKIANEIEFQPEDVLFLTDIPKEAYAAKKAGMNVTVIVRPGNAELSSKEREDFTTAENFDAI